MAHESFPNYPTLADAIEAGERVTVRWSYDNVRNLSEGQVAAIVAALRASTVSEKKCSLEALSALLVAEDADLDVCAPGNHGGRGDDAKRWLVTIMPSDHKNIREFFGDTLAEAMRLASYRQESEAKNG